MSASPPIASELWQRSEVTRGATSRHLDCTSQAANLIRRANSHGNGGRHRALSCTTNGAGPSSKRTLFRNPGQSASSCTSDGTRVAIVLNDLDPSFIRYSYLIDARSAEG